MRIARSDSVIFHAAPLAWDRLRLVPVVGALGTP
jgi:hypothetical protein